MFRGVLLTIVRGSGALAFGAVFLWQVAERAGPRDCRAIVHVTAAAVDIAIDDRPYRVAAPSDAPIVCDLRPGDHTLRMSRGGRVLFEEQFRTRPGEEVILTAWDSRPDRGTTAASPDSPGR